MRKRHAALALALALLASACGRQSPPQADPPPPAGIAADTPATQEGLVIVMLGDSLTAGYQLPPDAALPDAVQRILAARGVAVRIINAGVSGDTSADGLNRYDWSVRASGPDMLVIALGANDFLNDLSAASTRENLAGILERARADSISVVLLGVAPPPDLASRRPDKAAFGSVYPDLAATYEAPLLPDMLAPLKGRPDLVMSDGLHPNEAGVEAMAAAIADFIEPFLAEPRSAGPEGSR
jgi:acyl-CoA thioesterase-1